MKKILQKVFSLFKKNSPKSSAGRRKAKGQSMVEIAIALPLLMFMFLAMIEFGFMLNYYLSLLDATREAARFYSNLDPFAPDPTAARNASNWFYIDSADMVRAFLDPTLIPANVSYQGRRLILDSALDDVLITAYRRSNSGVFTCPPGVPYRVYGHATSNFSEANIQAQMITGSPHAGILVVEVDYSYEQILGLPYTAFLGEHVMLRAHTVMPLNAVEQQPLCN